MHLRTIREVKQLKGKRVLVRVDFNVPVVGGRAADDFKIMRSLSTIQWLRKKGARIIVVSHLGRPRGAELSLSLRPVCRRLGQALGKKVPLLPLSAIKKNFPIQDGQVVMLENIRFLKDEAKNTGTLARDLATLAEIFVLDGFGVAHRPAASVSGVARFLPAYAGLLLVEEISAITKAITNPARPLVVVLGGAKLETKLPLLKQLLPLADRVLLGAGIAATAWWAQGQRVGISVIAKAYQKEIVKYVRSPKLVLPLDVVVGEPNGRQAQVISSDSKFQIPNSKFGIYDIGPATIREYAMIIKRAGTIIWNGPMGYFEQPPYHFGSYAIAETIARRAKGRALAIVGGGETTEIIKKRGLADSIDLVSTGGGAMLEFLSGKKLPGIEALITKARHRLHQ